MKKLPKLKKRPAHKPQDVKLNEALRHLWVLLSFIDGDLHAVAKSLDAEDYLRLEITVKKLVTSLAKEKRSIVCR